MRIDPYRLEEMKRLHLPTIIRESGVELKDTGRESCMGRCPFHEDKSPSLSVGKRGDKWVWNCFGCGAKGNFGTIGRMCGGGRIPAPGLHSTPQKRRSGFPPRLL